MVQCTRDYTVMSRGPQIGRSGPCENRRNWLAGLDSERPVSGSECEQGGGPLNQPQHHLQGKLIWSIGPRPNILVRIRWHFGLVATFCRAKRL